MMNSPADNEIAARLQQLRNQYAELFMLLERSLEEDPLAEQTGGLDKAIAPLLAGVERELPEFRQAAARFRQTGGLSAACEAEITEFESLLQTGLQIMSKRVMQRTEQLAQEREQLKERMLQLRRKQKSAQGYGAFTHGRKLLDSNI